MLVMTFPRHVLRVDQFERHQLDDLLGHATHMLDVIERRGDMRLQGRILATLFYEPSTRTRLSFESAMLRLGGQVISAEYASATSSAVKGETIEDTVRIVESYADAIVIRHPVAGTADAAAAVARVPVINAGDGPREHPTQALLDLFTIQQELGRVDGLTVALVGDLRYGRAPRSLALLMARARGTRLLLVAPAGIEMSDDVLAALDELGVPWRIERDLSAALPEADVVYMTRVQKERFPDEASYDAVRGGYRLGAEHLPLLKRDAVLMHPLPRVDEIDPVVDADPRAAWFREAGYGVAMRMAVLDRLLNRGGLLA
jgi:aspartate carbamoyltransferase catalytic subunit